jgi:UPF0755 protein
MSTAPPARRPLLRSRGKWILALAAGALLVGGGALAAWTARVLVEPFQGYAEEGATFRVEEGELAAGVLERLETRGILRDATVARAYLVYVLEDPPIKAGDYRFAGPLTARQVLAKLVAGEVETESVTLVEGLTREETAAALAAAGFGELEALLAATRDPSLVADLDPAAPDLEGYLFPDTYSFARGTAAEEVVAALVANFRRRYEAQVAPLLEGGAKKGEGPPAGESAAAAGPEAAARRSLRAVVTLASVVEKEGKVAEELPLIAGVYANRLERGMALYADPTVIFALKRLGRWDGNLTRQHLQLDSPYNTYRHAGLPPGPICSPGLGALLAAARPAAVPFLYFVSRNDGTHVFAATLREHNRNVERWQREFWRDQRRRATSPPTDEVSGNN